MLLNGRQDGLQASVRPVSYITKVPKQVQRRTGRAAGSAKQRSREELRQGVAEWVAKKYQLPAKVNLMQTLCPGLTKQAPPIGIDSAGVLLFPAPSSTVGGYDHHLSRRVR
jgi:hypothetical protein